MARFLRESVIFCLLIIFIISMPVSAFGSYSAAEFSVGSTIYRINGAPKVMDAAPFIKSGRTYIPLRYAANSLGIPESGITFKDNGVIMLNRGTTSVIMVIGDPMMFISGRPLRMDAVPTIVKGRTFLPARYIAEAFGCDVKWNKSSGTVLLSLEVQTSQVLTSDQVIYKWTYRGSNCSIGPLDLPGEIKTYYTNKDHPELTMDMRTGQNNFQSYVDNYTLEPDYQGIVASLSESLKTTAQQDGYHVVPFVASFVQGLNYISDNSLTDDYAKYPVETLYDKGGDCEDTAILAAAMLRHLGYECALLIFPGTAENPGHMAVGIADDGTLSGSYYTQGGKRYYYLEITAPGWKIGEVPDKYQDLDTYVVPVK